jgi:hypothetical protein
VRAADAVLKQAETGIVHWEGHVDAQRQWDKGAITLEERQKRFAATRVLGPADQKRYAEALRTLERTEGPCGKVKGAGAEAASDLASCEKRSKAQRPVMSSAAGAMGDWKQHLADMQRSRETHVSNAQQVWLALYRRAPVNINAYEKALRDFDAPRC